MNSTESPGRVGVRSRMPRALAWFSCISVMAFVIACSPGQAAEKDDAYLEIFNLIQQGDALFTGGNTTNALSKYQRAQAALQNFRKAYPDWNVKTVTFRLDYLADQVAACLEKAAPGDRKEGKPEVKPVVAAAPSPVKLLDAGAEPRKVLRLNPKAGDKQTLGMTMKMGMEIQVGEMQNQAVKVPAIKMPMDVTIKTVSADGDITYETVMGEPRIADDGASPAEVTDAIKASLASVKGLTGTGTISSRGLVKAVDIKVPPGADPQARQAMEQMKESISQMGTPFAEEAVGPGAKWEVNKPIKSQGMTIDETTTYQLVSIDGDNVTAKSVFVQSASNQKIQNPAMPGMKLDLTKMTGRGSGDLKLNLAQLMPSEATVDSHSEITMGMDVGGQKQTMVMKMNMNLRFEAQ